MSGKNPLGNGKEPQSYEGLNITVPVGGWNFVRAKVDPTANANNAKKNPVGTLWLNTTTSTLWCQTTPNVWTQLSLAGGAGTFLSVTSAGNITATNGNIILGTAGNKLISSSVGTTASAGANSIGSVTLVAGTATVATTAVTANSLIVIWRQSIGATGAAALGQLAVGTITPGTSFVINAALTATATSLATTDVSVVGYEIIN